MNRLKAVTVLLALSILTFSLTTEVSASGTEEFSDILSVIDVALADGDMDAIKTLIHEEVGLSVAGQEILPCNFDNLIHDTTSREFNFVSSEGTVTVESSFEEILWGDAGVFSLMDDVTMSHYMVIDRDDLFNDSTYGLWEHGELETAVVFTTEDFLTVYIFPDLIYKFELTRIDELWYLTRIAAWHE